MKQLMRLYNSCRYALRIAFVGFMLIGFGYLIQNEGVNIFYTFTNRTLLLVADGAYKLGKVIILNLPLIFMVNLVCKRANSGFPIILAIVGYATYMITISLFANQTMDFYVYNTALGGLVRSGSTLKAYETGLVGAFLVAFATRFSFIASRNKGRYSLFGFLNKDTVAIVYNILACALLGLLIAYLYPIGYRLLQQAIQYIAKNLADPRRMGLYGLIDRALSMLGMSELIRYPFWYTSLGGSYSSIMTGQVVVGDVNIWNYIQDAASTYVGAGRFITPYYIINLFVIPGIYLGMYFSVSDKRERAYHLIPMLFVIGVSFVCGNPLPVELTLLFTAPLLLIIYLLVVSGVFIALSFFEVYLGFANVSGDIVTAMPGSFPDYIINLRNINLSDDVTNIFFIGLFFLAVMFVLTLLYYRFLAYDILNTGKKEEIGNLVIEMAGGISNISNASNSLLKVYIELYDLEIVSASKAQQLPNLHIVETKEGLSFEPGVSAEIIAKYINSCIKKERTKNNSQ